MHPPSRAPEPSALPEASWVLPASSPVTPEPESPLEDPLLEEPPLEEPLLEELPLEEPPLDMAPPESSPPPEAPSGAAPSLDSVGGVVREGDALKAVGAGLLSSFGELGRFEREANLVPFDLEVIVRTPFDPTQYQSTLFVAPSEDALLSSLTQWLEHALAMGVTVSAGLAQCVHAQLAMSHCGPTFFSAAVKLPVDLVSFPSRANSMAADTTR